MKSHYQEDQRQGFPPAGPQEPEHGLHAGQEARSVPGWPLWVRAFGCHQPPHHSGQCELPECWTWWQRPNPPPQCPPRSLLLVGHREGRVPPCPVSAAPPPPPVALLHHVAPTCLHGPAQPLWSDSQSPGHVMTPRGTVLRGPAPRGCCYVQFLLSVPKTLCPYQYLVTSCTQGTFWAALGSPFCWSRADHSFTEGRKLRSEGTERGARGKWSSGHGSLLLV